MNKNLSITVAVLVVVVFGYVYLYSSPKEQMRNGVVDEALAAKFDYLIKNENSSCSASFKDFISSMSDDTRLQGSCYSPMNMRRYSEQIEELKKYSNIAEIPPDPYDIKNYISVRNAVLSMPKKNGPRNVKRGARDIIVATLK